MSVEGVTRARVTFENAEAVVTYDPGRCTVEDMIEAVEKVEGVDGPNQYRAKVKDAE